MLASLEAKIVRTIVYLVEFLTYFVLVHVFAVRLVVVEEQWLFVLALRGGPLCRNSNSSISGSEE